MKQGGDVAERSKQELAKAAFANQQRSTGRDVRRGFTTWHPEEPGPMAAEQDEEHLVAPNTSTAVCTRAINTAKEITPFHTQEERDRGERVAASWEGVVTKVKGPTSKANI